MNIMKIFSSIFLLLTGVVIASESSSRSSSGIDLFGDGHGQAARNDDASKKIMLLSPKPERRTPTPSPMTFDEWKKKNLRRTKSESDLAGYTVSVHHYQDQLSGQTCVDDERPQQDACTNCAFDAVALALFIPQGITSVVTGFLSSLKREVASVFDTTEKTE